MSSPLKVGMEMLMNRSFFEGSCYLSAVAIAPGSVHSRCTASQIQRSQIKNLRPKIVNPNA
jgi:hypothetical protein